mgnify:CR=1 FL=1
MWLYRMVRNYSIQLLIHLRKVKITLDVKFVQKDKTLIETPEKLLMECKKVKKGIETKNYLEAIFKQPKEEYNFLKAFLEFLELLGDGSFERAESANIVHAFLDKTYWVGEKYIIRYTKEIGLSYEKRIT